MKNRPQEKAFSLVELLMVIAVMAILIATVGVSITNLLANTRRDNALGQITNVFRAAQAAALATNQERRVVIRSQESRFDYWVEKKINKVIPWDGNFSEPLDDVQNLPAGVVLVDIDGLPVPEPSYNSFIYAPDGSIKAIQRNSRTAPEETVGNIALHFTYSGPVIDLRKLDLVRDGKINQSDVQAARWPLPSEISYNNAEFTYVPPFSDQMKEDLKSLSEDSYTRFTVRPQVHTLYLLHLTGQAVSYDYGIYSPWPRKPLPETAQGPS
jgi:prepilin-type N-terminal cleavage/methylation domain-containing protein